MLKNKNRDITLHLPEELFKDLQKIADDSNRPLAQMLTDWSETIVNTIEYGSNVFYCDNCEEHYFFKGFFLESECPNCKE